jgi:protein O-GlcNAc transferase
MGRFDQIIKPLLPDEVSDPEKSAEQFLEHGMQMEQQGMLDDALRCYDSAIGLRPELARAHFNRGNILLDRGDAQNALHAYTQAAKYHPDSAGTHFNLGAAYVRLDRQQDAVSAYRRAITLKPDFADAHLALGSELDDLGEKESAVVCYRRALEFRPDFVEGHIRLANVLTQIPGQLTAAVASYRQALALQPDTVPVLTNLACALKDLGELNSALDCIRKALELDPNYALAHNNLLFIHNYLGDQSASLMLADARRFGEVAARSAHPFTHWPNSPDPERPLRVGFVSGDLCIHPVGHFVEAVFAALSAQAHHRLELLAYPTSPCYDDVSRRIQTFCDGWHSVADLSDEALARRIREDHIDILIDLSGHTAHNRLTMFAWRPAPVQASWLGYFATTGLPTIDYFIADHWTLPASEEAFFTEQIWRLPQTRLCFTVPDPVLEVGPLPALSNGHLTFGCFNNLTKMNDVVVATWAKILNLLPGSRLCLKYKQIAEVSMRQSICNRFAAHGIAADRLTLEEFVPRGDYLASYQGIDIALDPFPYPGGTTTIESLWMGVPVLTLAGERFLSRQGVGILMNAGLPGWIAKDAEDYVKRAVSYAKDWPGLASQRATLRAQVLASPLFDATRFAAYFADMAHGMWEKWCVTQQSRTAINR